MSNLRGKTILLGVAGSIAAYKAAELASSLTQQGAAVQVILTAGAEKFITPLTFQSITGRKAYTDADLWSADAHILHVGLAHGADLMVTAPCTANSLTKLAQGQADNLLTITALALQAPLLIAPAMDAGMYQHPAVQKNVSVLVARGASLVGPAQGRMASGLVGWGRMMEAAQIAGRIRLALGRGGRLAGKRVVITAAGSQEPIDPVRYLSNRSSGKQGYALAQAALDFGAQVTLISHPSCLTPPEGADLVRVGSAQEMQNAVLQACEEADGLVMAAAVADFTVKDPAAHKLKKRDGVPALQLTSAPDVLAGVAEARARLPRLRAVIGFAAESQDVLQNAVAKLKSKKLDLIVANDVSSADAGFAVDTNRVTFLFADGRQVALPLKPKEEVAEDVISQLASFLE